MYCLHASREVSSDSKLSTKSFLSFMFPPSFIPSTAHRITISKRMHCKIINNKRYILRTVKNAIAVLLACTYYSCTLNEKGVICLDENETSRTKRKMPAKRDFTAASKTA